MHLIAKTVAFGQLKQISSIEEFHHFPHKIPDCDVVCSDYLSQQEISDSIESSEAIFINEEIKEILPL